MKKIYIVALLLSGTKLLQAQTTYLQSGTPEYHLLDRLETMNGVLTDDFSSTIKPISRKEAVRFLTQQKNDVRFPKAEVKNMGYIDYQNMEREIGRAHV